MDNFAKTEVQELSLVFSVDTRVLGRGMPLMEWSPDGSLLATAGSSKVVHVVDSKTGSIVKQVVPPAPSRCLELAWNDSSQCLAIVQEASKLVVLWHRSRDQVEYLDSPVKDLVQATWTKAGPAEETLLLTSNRGRLFALDVTAGVCTSWDSGGKNQARKRINALTSVPFTREDGKEDMVLVYASEGSILNIATVKGHVLHRVNLKGRIASIRCSTTRSSDYLRWEVEETGLNDKDVFTGTYDNIDRVRYLSVLFDEGVLLLYRLSIRDLVGVSKKRSDSLSSALSQDSSPSGGQSGTRRRSAADSVGVVGNSDKGCFIKLVFEESYSRVVEHQWFDEDHLVIGFANGTLVAISTHDEDRIGEEKCRARYLRRAMQDMSCSHLSHLMATCAEDTLQVFDLMSWSLVSYQRVGSQSRVVAVKLNAQEGLVGVSCEDGSVYCFRLPYADPEEVLKDEPVDVVAMLQAPVSPSALFALYLSFMCASSMFVARLLNTDLWSLAHAMRIM